MKAVVLAAPGDLRVESVPEPALVDPGDAIVRVSAAAICGADLFPYHGHTPGFENGTILGQVAGWVRSAITILGHEFVGTVEEVGPRVAGPRPGQRVVNTSMTSDGSCAHCRAGRRTQCTSRSLFGYSGVYPRLEGGQPSSCACRPRIAASGRSRTRFPTSTRSSSRTCCPRGMARCAAAVWGSATWLWCSGWAAWG